jgi:hypothetical protein
MNLEADRRSRAALRKQQVERTERELARKRQLVEAKIQSLRAELASDEDDAQARLAADQVSADVLAELNVQRMAERTRPRTSRSPA